MSYAHSVAIGPEFFKKAFHDYADRYWAFAREVLQNSIDCGSRNIHITVAEVDADGDHPQTLVTVGNDGAPMTREILVDKLLSLGSSGKDFRANSVGGFGKAKEILYFAHERYRIVSGEWEVSGSGAMYDLGPHGGYHAGTRSEVWWNGSAHVPRLRDAFRRFVELCGCKGVTFLLDEEELKPALADKQLVRTLEHKDKAWAKAYTTRSVSNRVVVRVNGIPMFSRHCDYRKGVVLELEGASSETLTSNRDGLRYPFDGELSDLVTKLAVDRRSVFKLETAVYERFGGNKLGRPGGSSPAPVESVADLLMVVAARSGQGQGGGGHDGGGGIAVDVAGRVDRGVNLLPHEFIIKNCVRRAVPEAFHPHSLKFSDHAAWLVRAWAGCLIELHELLAVDKPFSVGFIFAEDCEAESEDSREYGHVYYLNPCVVTRRSMRRRFAKKHKAQIAADAAHEFIHGGLGEHYHGEEFANKYTDVMGLVIQNWRRFARHFN